MGLYDYIFGEGEQSNEPAKIMGGDEEDWQSYGESLAEDIPEITWQGLGNVALDFTPIIGDIKGGYETIQMIGDELAKENPNYYMIGALGGLGAAATIIGLVPGAGDAAASAIRAGARSLQDTAGKVSGEIVGNTRALLDGDMDFIKGRGNPQDAQAAGAEVVRQPFDMGKGSGATDNQTNELFGMGHNEGPPLETNMANVINARANEMTKPVSKRTGSKGEPLFDTSPEAYERNTVKQEEIYVPRNPNPDAMLPLGDRSRPVQEMSEEIAEVLAQRMEKWKGTAAQYFYNTEPIREKALAMGYSKEYVDDWMKEFSEAYAATSPRTDTATNMRNATLVMAKKEAEVPLETLIGPGTGGISEKGYNMMTSDSGIHRILTNQVEAGGINPNNNTKPFTFAKNVEGNLQGSTIDTHAIRGALDAMNEISPGSIPDGWIEPKWLDAYKEDPSQLNAVTWLKDTLGKQQIDGTAMQTEYAVFSDIYKLAGEKAKVSPAESQSMGWFGSGEKTGLKSETATIVELLDERVGVTANVMGFSREEIFRMLMDRKIPLLSIIGASAALGAAIAPEDKGFGAI